MKGYIRHLYIIFFKEVREARLPEAQESRGLIR